jgi:uncharacterized protein (TIGR03083 family)
MDVRDTYAAAARVFADLVGRIPSGAWDNPALGVWSVRDLLGHAHNAGVALVTDVLDQPPAPTVAIPSPEAYYALARSVDPAMYKAAVAASEERARQHGAALGQQPAAVIRDEVEAAIAQLADAKLDTVIQTLAGGMSLETWLPTRTFELVVHSVDLAAAAGVPVSVPNEIMADAGALAARIAVEMGEGTAVLLALTGRAPLPEGFTFC